MPSLSPDQFSYLESLASEAPGTLDLTSPADLDTVVALAGRLIDETADLPELETIASAGVGESLPLGLAVAAKLALSKAIVAGLERPLFLSIVFAVYKEHQRILTPEEHPHGEDFLVRKVRQLEWLFGDHLEIGWELIIVDDGCPENSGGIAQSIIDRHQLGDQVRVCYLAEAIEQGLAGAGDLESASESQKGGGILYGLWEALQVDRSEGGHCEHFLLYTDADLSTHLGQIGLLLDPLINRHAVAAIGSRRERASVVVKTGTRNTRGKLFIYLWKRLIGMLPEVIDTQCAFKAFPAEIAEQIIAPAIEKKFAFDIELLIKSALLDAGPIINGPLAWIDSEAASTTTDLEPYLSMLQSIVRMYRAYLPDSPEAEPFAAFVESLDTDAWDRLCENVPQAIAECEPFELGSRILVTADELAAASAVA